MQYKIPCSYGQAWRGLVVRRAEGRAYSGPTGGGNVVGNLLQRRRCWGEEEGLVVLLVFRQKEKKKTKL